MLPRIESVMKSIKLSEIRRFVKVNIKKFHDARLKCLQETKLDELLKNKNPYLFKAKALLTAPDLVASLLEARLSSSEEELFGTFLEDLAIFVAGKSLGARKSGAAGIDFEYTINKTYYLVAVKSGRNWGNNSQWEALVANFKRASNVLRQSGQVADVKCILAISYGKSRSSVVRGFIHQIFGQNFWHMISGDTEFYKKIVEPLGHNAVRFNSQFSAKKVVVIKNFTEQFKSEYCNQKGSILWTKLVEYNSGNLLKVVVPKKAKMKSHIYK